MTKITQKITEDEFFKKMDEYNKWKHYFFCEYDKEYDENNTQQEELISKLCEENKARDSEFRDLELAYYCSQEDNGMN